MFTNLFDSSRLRSEKGFTLIELLISTLVVSIGMLAVQSMFVMKIKNNATAQRLTIADNIAVGIVEKFNNAPYYIASQGTPNTGCNLAVPNDNIVDCLRPDSKNQAIPQAPFNDFTSDVSFNPVDGGVLVKKTIAIQADTPSPNMKKLTVTVEWKIPSGQDGVQDKIKSITYIAMRDRGVK